MRCSELLNKSDLYEKQLQAKDAQHAALYDQLIQTIHELDSIKAKYTQNNPMTRQSISNRNTLL